MFLFLVKELRESSTDGSGTLGKGQIKITSKSPRLR